MSAEVMPPESTPNRTSVTYPQVLLACVVFGFVALLIALGHPPTDAVTTAAGTGALAAALSIVPCGARAAGRGLARLLRAGLTAEGGPR
ncbi:hypothetical protein ACTG9Q_24655 [Actinokineospora sp. 24-640]